MAQVYRTVMRGSGMVAAMASAAWAVAAGMSLSDGPGGIEVPRWTSTAGVMVIVCSTIISGGAWIVEMSHSIAAEKHIRRVVREEFDRVLAEAMPLLVATIVEAIERRAQAYTEDLAEICHDLHRKTLIAGQLMRAGGTEEAVGKAALKVVPRNHYVSTSREE